MRVLNLPTSPRSNRAATVASASSSPARRRPSIEVSVYVTGISWEFAGRGSGQAGRRRVGQRGQRGLGGGGDVQFLEGVERLLDSGGDHALDAVGRLQPPH